MSGFVGWNRKMKHQESLKRIRKDFRVFFVQFIQQLIPDAPGQSSSKTPG